MSGNTRPSGQQKESKMKRAGIVAAVGLVGVSAATAQPDLTSEEMAQGVTEQ